MKWVTWLVKLCAAALIISMVSLYATWTAVQMMVGKVLDQYQLGSELQKIEFSDFLAEFVSSLNIMEHPARNGTQAGKDHPNQTGGSASAGADKKAAGTGGTQPGMGSGDLKTGDALAGTAGGSIGSGTGVTNDGSGDPRYSGTAGKQQEALPAWSQSSTGMSDAQEKTEKKTVLSTEALQNTKDKISGEDKMKLFSMVYSKLPSAELQNISRLMEDGITQEELSQMESIVKKYMTKEEFDELMTILGKYE
ncbi:hypothetical protein [Gorillibacterium sp. sgz5001074]|uniref:hypothetical protein n=1 Tax=Gorillibacterium sp. sgz5001074 TaxID=3446695 RepID=UPI003F664FBB